MTNSRLKTRWSRQSAALLVLLSILVGTTAYYVHAGYYRTAIFHDIPAANAGPGQAGDRDAVGRYGRPHRHDPPNYPLGLPYDLLRDFDDDVTLHVVVSSSLLSSAQSNLAAQGVDMDRVEFLVRPNDSIWTRDYGPWFVFDGDGDIADHRPHLQPPLAAQRQPDPRSTSASQQGIPVHSHDMYHTGGNYMTDGAHISSLDAAGLRRGRRRTTA